MTAMGDNKNAMTILVSQDGKTRETWSRVPAWAHDGLAVHRGVTNATTWTITHAPSGYLIWEGVRTKQIAQGLAEQLLGLGDWTRSHPEITADTELRRRYRELRHQLAEPPVVFDNTPPDDSLGIPPAQTNILDAPLGVLDLDPNLANRLRRSTGFATVGQVASCSAREIESIRQVGPKSLRALEAALARHGLTLRGKPDPMHELADLGVVPA